VSELGGEPLDPDEPLRSRLLRVGVSAEQIDEATELGSLELLALEHLAIPDPAVYDVEQLAQICGLPTDQIVVLWRSLGFAEPQPGDIMFTQADAEMLSTLAGYLASQVIDADLVVQMARVIGQSLARIAVAFAEVVDPQDHRRTDRRADTVTVGDAVDRLGMVTRVLDYVLRRHLQSAARSREVTEAGAATLHRVIGFADLVGFTAMSQQISAHELAAVVDRFESIAYETIADLGGRVVKMIGDEVMFSVEDERTAAEIALTLAATYRDDSELSDVRVALASGPVLQREADYYGPVVNRASRIVSLAYPGAVVVSDELHAVLASDDRFAWRPLGARQLKDIGRVPLWVLRRGGPRETSRRSWERADEARRGRRRRHRDPGEEAEDREPDAAGDVRAAPPADDPPAP